MSQKINAEHIKQAGELIIKLSSEKSELEKVAKSAEMEKKAQKIAFKEIEMGLSEPFKTFEQFQEKIASLVADDLDLIEKALERGYSGSKTQGQLAENDAAAIKNPLEHLIRTGELIT